MGLYAPMAGIAALMVRNTSILVHTYAENRLQVAGNVVKGTKGEVAADLVTAAVAEDVLS
eukprot:751828-Hanusia_phi.AAC.3